MTALVLVDVQNDFLEGGSLAVPNGDKVIDPANELLKRTFDWKVVTQDWHPDTHVSFAVNHDDKKVGDSIQTPFGEQLLWPVHCVQNTYGASLSKKLDTACIDYMVHKGKEALVDSYSAFFDNGKNLATELHQLLQDRRITQLVVGGLATDYCVLATVIDALDLGYTVVVVEEAVVGIDLVKGDVLSAKEKMIKKGAIWKHLADI